MYALINCKIYTGKNILKNHAVIIFGSIIYKICPISFVPSHIKKYDLKGCYLSPGFIDLQLNGCGGVQFNNKINSISVRTLEKMQLTNQKFGCTSFLPTVITSSNIFIKKAIQVMHLFLLKYKNQALGLHLEGPFLNPIKKGIHNSSLFRKPTKDIIRFLCKNSHLIRKITLAPEKIHYSLINKLKLSGICISIGHSNATCKETKLSFSHGISFATHLFNAMPPIFGREPGIIGAVFDNPNIYCSIIADGIHVDWTNIKNAKKIKGDHLILVTDAIMPAGNKKIKKFNFSNKIIYHKNGTCIDKNGTLSGSSLTMIKAIKNIIENANVSLDEALRMATLYPARAIKVDHLIGQLKVGKIANLTSFTHDYKIYKTIVNGKIVYSS